MGKHSIRGPDDDFADEPFGDHIPDPRDGDTDPLDYFDHRGYADSGSYLHEDRPAAPTAPVVSRIRRRGIEEWHRGRRRIEQWRRRRSLGEWRGGHRNEGGPRGVSVGVIAALVAVIVVVAAVILWRFFGSSLSHRSDVAAGRCVAGQLTVAVIADPSIADHMQGFAEKFNKSAKPVGDRCVSVQVKPADSDAVVSGFVGDWPAQLGERPALWIPGSSISAARLQAVTGKQTVSDTRSLVTSPVLLAVRPELKSALQKENWSALPRLQSNPDSLADLNLPGWGSLRLALPIDGNSDAAFLAAEAVASTSGPPGAPATEGVGAVRTLVDAQPKLADNSLTDAMNTLLRQGVPADALVHAVVTTEQQLFSRGESLTDAASKLGSWLPPGAVPVADYPTALLSGSWLSEEQVSAASEFARFAHKAGQLAELAKAGFRVPDIAPPSSDVTGFEPLPATLSVGDDELRATLAGTLATSAGGSTTIMLDQSMNTSEGGDSRFGNVVTALRQRIAALPPNSAVGLWTFDGTEGRTVVSSGPLDDQVDGQPRNTALTDALSGVRSTTSGGAVSFTTLRMIYDDALANYVAGQPNSILVITAGPHTDRSLDGSGLQDYIRGATDPQRPVAVNVIDFGNDSDRTTWQTVARLSGGSYQNLASSNSPELATALSTLLS
jgi:hypothetical protein